MESIAALRKIRVCEGEVAAQLVLEYAISEAVAAEREACAKVCDELDKQYVAFASSAAECATRIRERANVKLTFEFTGLRGFSRRSGGISG